MTSIFKIVVYDTWNITSSKVSFYLLQYDQTNHSFFSNITQPLSNFIVASYESFLSKTMYFIQRQFQKHFSSLSTIPDKIFWTKKRNLTKLDKARKVWYLLLRVFWLVLTKFNFSKGSSALDHISTQIWDFSNIS